MDRRFAGAGALAVLTVEVVGSLAMWAPVPLAWIWVGARAYEATDRMFAGGVVALLGILATTTLLLVLLVRLDSVWVTLRRRAGHEQPEGAFTRVVVASATLGLIGFVIFYYVSGAFVMPFMPMQ